MAAIKETIKATGALSVTVTGPDGQVKDKFDINNLVVDVGKEYIAQRMVDLSIPGAMSHMAIGSGATGAGEAIVGDTALTTEEGRVALTGGVGVVTANNNEVQYDATFPAGTGTGAITEAGILNAGAGGVMLCRTTFAVVNKGADDTLSITWVVTIN